MSDNLDAFAGTCGSQEYLGSSGAVGSRVEEGKTDESNEIVDAAANPGDGVDSMLGRGDNDGQKETTDDTNNDEEKIFSDSDDSQEQYGQSADFLSP
eukprot:959527-Ditylum_brightwellii.AAC.1